MGTASATLSCAPASVIVATHGEASCDRRLHRHILAALPEAEIIFLDGGTADGSTLFHAIEKAASDICVFLEADPGPAIHAIPALVRAVEDGADIAVGARHGRLSPAERILARPLTKVRDPLSGFFCVRRSILRGGGLRRGRFNLLLEILARSGTRAIHEVPVCFEERARHSGQGRRSFKQFWTLYREVNAWPWRLVKFLSIGATGFLVHLAVLCALVEFGGVIPSAAAVGGFAVAMSSNYVLNRFWTFRAGEVSFVSSYAIYALGAIAGLGVQLGTMQVLSQVHYALAASLGIVLGTSLTFFTSQLWAFAKR